MENIIENEYYKSVNSLTDDVLNNCSDWYNYIFNLPISQQVTYTVVVFNTQVENGGFHQYFFNAYGQFAYLTIKNLKLIRSFERAKLLQKALEYVNEDNLNEDKFRELIFNRKLNKITDFDKELFNKLNGLDTVYYNTHENDIYDLLTTFLESN